MARPVEWSGDVRRPSWPGGSGARAIGTSTPVLGWASGRWSSPGQAANYLENCRVEPSM